MRTLSNQHHGSTRGQYPAQCSICGVPWPRSKMQRTLGGLLVCPDDVGPDAATLDKLNARAARRQPEPRAAPDLFVESYSDPSTILGDSLHSWFKPNSLNDVECDVDLRVHKLYNRTSESDALRVAGARRPRFAQLPGGTHHGVVGGNGWDIATPVFSASLAAGSRPYVWVVAQLSTAPGAARVGLQFGGSATQTPLRLDSSGNYGAILVCSDGTDTITGPAADTDVHLFEAGWNSTATARFVVDGTAVNGARTGGLSAAATFVAISNSLSAWPGAVYEVVVATSATAAQLASMRSYFAAQFTEIDFA